MFVDAGGKRQPFRFRLTPDEGTTYLSASDAATAEAGLPVRRAAGTAGPAAGAVPPDGADRRGRATRPDDATKPWPDDRQLVDLGTIELTKVVDDSATAEKQLLFTPTNLTDGIEASDDPLIATRADAYAGVVQPALQSLVTSPPHARPRCAR